MTAHVISADGTRIAYERTGSGHPLILVDGAGGYRGFGPLVDLPGLLAGDHSVVHYDRRGRGDSGDTLPYAPDREVEDLAALIDAVGGEADLFGISSGAGLVLRAIAAGLPVRKAVVYEPPYINEAGEGHRAPDEALESIKGMLSSGRTKDAVSYFLVDTVGSPRFVPFMMRFMPGAPMKKLRAIAHTLAYDIEVMDPFRVPADTLASVSVPTVAVAGGKSPDNMQKGVEAVARAIPGGEFEVLPGQTHMIQAKGLAPVLQRLLA